MIHLVYKFTKGLIMTSELTSELGCMTLIEGLLDILREVNGDEVTGDLIYMNFFRKGEKIGEKIGTGKDPQTALKQFIEYIKFFFDIEIINENSKEKEYTAEIRFEGCLIKDMCSNQGLSLRNPLCRSTQGLFEGALSFMTGKQVCLNISIAEQDICQGTVQFKKKRDIFHFI
jgi:predicted hydrocarbon binding protein